MSTRAFALHTLITEDGGTQGAGGMQLELTASHERDHNGDVTTHQIDPTVVLTYGVADAVDVMVSIPYLQVRSDSPGGSVLNSGWSDPGLALKWRFYEQDHLGIAVIPAVFFALGDNTRGLDTGYTGYSLPLVMTRQWMASRFTPMLRSAETGLSWANANTFGMLRWHSNTH